MKRLFLHFLLLLICFSTFAVDRFQIKENQFVLDGKQLQLICGEMHYPRIPKEYWRDRLKRAKAMGLNTVSAYVFWNFHERQPGKFDFKGQADLSEFIHIAQEEGLWVLLRPGPYVCAEWDFGGYPSWLLKQKDMLYRSSDVRFLDACRRYINRLGKELSKQTINKGGNIIMLQVENEYGSYGNDKVYLSALRDMIIDAGFDVPLITCDGGGQIESGHVDGVLPTVNGVLGEDIFRIVDNYHKGGPYFVAEFYPAWFDVWGKPHSFVHFKNPANQLDWMLSHNVSVSMYMFHGGTNFGYTNGANTANGYAPQPTSYDYDAPLSEWGTSYPKYHAFREVIKKHLPKGEVLPEVPADNPVISFETIELKESAPLSAIFSKTRISENILSMEDMGQDFGYIHYETILPLTGTKKLQIRDLRDYAVVVLNGEYIGSLDRRHSQNNLEISVVKPNSKLEILVENVGRVNYGPDILYNCKGITHEVLWGDEKLFDWKITALPLYKENPGKIKYGKSIIGRPAFHKGHFFLQNVGDCFIDLSAWGKGAVWVNGHSLGKFWNIGPQQTLYVPAPWLRKGKNEIIVFVYEDTGCRKLRGLSEPILDMVGVDKNQTELLTRNNSDRQPILEKGDIVLENCLKLQNEWQTFTFNGAVSLRHFCIETNSCYEEDGEACIVETELIGEDGEALNKSKWSIVYVDSEQINNRIGIAENMIDGDISSFWHTDVDHKTAHPHHIIIDTNEIFKVKGIRLKVREGAFLSGKVKNFRVYGRPQFFLFK